MASSADHLAQLNEQLHAALDVEGLLELYSRADWQALSERFLRAFAQFEALPPVAALGRAEQYRLDRFVHFFLFLFTQPEFIVPAQLRSAFVVANVTIANLVATSSAETSDAWLPLLVEQPDNLAKLMALYSPRNATRLEAGMFFNVNPQAASLWYWLFFRSYFSSLADANSHDHLNFQLANLDGRLEPSDAMCDGYFAATYVSEELDHLLKGRVHQTLRTSFKSSGLRVSNRPNGRRIGIVTGTWRPGHSVYRNHYDIVAALAQDYELVLINTASPDQDCDESLFQEVIDVRRTAAGVPIDKLAVNDFALLYYPDIGLTFESLVLANARLAPIQITSYGHSVSSFGADMDYYLASEDAEDLGQLSVNYSERVVLLPGLGVTNIRPGYTPAPARLNTDRVIVSCSWYCQKINPGLLRAVRKILDRCDPGEVLFRIFGGTGLGVQGHFLPFAKAVRESLGAENVEIIPPIPFDRYLEEMNRGHFALEPFPFGGCNTIVDSLHLRQPILTIQGRRWYSRVGTTIMRQAGIEELVATSVHDYVEKATRMVREPAYLAELRGKIEALDLDELLYQKSYAETFKTTVDYLLANHERLKDEGSREPIFMSKVLAAAARS